MREITVQTIMSAEAILASASADSDVLDLNAFKPEKDRMGLQLVLAGTGTAKLEVFLSADNSIWVESGDGDVATTVAAGNSIYEITPELMRYIKIKVTEDGGAAAITVTSLKLVIQ